MSGEEWWHAHGFAWACRSRFSRPRKAVGVPPKPYLRRQLNFALAENRRPIFLRRRPQPHGHVERAGGRAHANAKLATISASRKGDGFSGNVADMLGDNQFQLDGGRDGAITLELNLHDDFTARNRG